MRFNRYHFKYEVYGILSNFVSMFFSFIFPILITCLIGYGIGRIDAPDYIKQEIVSRIFVGNMVMIPLSICLISYATFFATEIENHMIQRLELFGISQMDIFLHRFLAYFLYITFSTTVYILVVRRILDIYQAPIFRYVVLLLCYLFFGIILLMISHGISILVGRMSFAYSLTMMLYFGMLIIGGNMGIQVKDFPKVLQMIAKTNIVTYFSTNLKGSIISYWLGKSNQIYMTIYVLLIWFLVALFFLYLVTRYRKKNPLY